MEIQTYCGTERQSKINCYVSLLSLNLEGEQYTNAAQNHRVGQLEGATEGHLSKLQAQAGSS